MTDPDQPKTKINTPRATIALRIAVAAVLSVTITFGIWYAYVYAASPKAIRQPAATHYHLRLQVVVGGQAVNFADKAFQTPKGADICTAALTTEPIHFHDGLNQFVHIHWKGITGGLLLKNYGWNLTGGLPGELGYKFEKYRPVAIPIHGNALPSPPPNSDYYIYTGTAAGYQQRDWGEFQAQDLETFLKKTGPQTSWLDAIIPAARAHAGHGHPEDPTRGDDPALVKLNNLVGNIVIFAQATKPTDEQIKSRFNNLIDLPTSSCSG
jgi:hypothetical protein